MQGWVDLSGGGGSARHNEDRWTSDRNDVSLNDLKIVIIIIIIIYSLMKYKYVLHMRVHKLDKQGY